jgi:hypothetical protein
MSDVSTILSVRRLFREPKLEPLKTSLAPQEARCRYVRLVMLRIDTDEATSRGGLSGQAR